jgi:Flp pilus assembly protein TadG
MSLLRCLQRAGRWPKRFRRDETGVTAVEFGLLAPIFFLLMFMILETALHFFQQQILETAVGDAARMIMTGQAKSASMTQAQYKTKVCGLLPAMFDCSTKCQVDVRTAASFSLADLTKPIVAGAVNWGTPNTPQWAPGNGGDIVITRVICELPIFTDYFGAYAGGSKLGNGNMAVMATTARRNEPFL